MIATVLGFVLTLGVLIVVHEYGHYRVAVACGVKVQRFSVGFGRVLLRRVRGADRTEFVLCALPLGGYVKMLDEREEPVAPHELHRAFNRQTLPRRAAIVAAGPIANLLLAVLLYAGAHWIGIEEPKAVLGSPPAGSAAEAAGLRGGDWVRAVSRDGLAWDEVDSMTDLRWQITQAVLAGRSIELEVSDREGHGARSLHLDLGAYSARDVDTRLLAQIGFGAPFSEARIGEVRAGSPGAAAGLQPGDRVLAVDGRPVDDATALVQRVRGAVNQGEGVAMRWRVERTGRELELNVVPRVVIDASGAVGRIDTVVGGMPDTVVVRHGAIDGLVQGASRTWEVSALTVRMLGNMLVGEASLKNLSGPLTIADYAGQSVQRGPAVYLAFLALVSVSLGVLNLLPLPMLDGGHLMYYIFEAVTGRPVSELWLARLQRGGIAVLLMMMSLALFNDVARLLGLH
ncbi:RIP metalloprotease RseP [Rubrivivax gelatinosus]|uniref:RIP metalloprotease RseP n=1 Tax=Rubrivivax gelatinosus TaxID=28068 RepID=UPI001907569E|nr:RIP metalloprotease RseP [Rubrivivax gelatinosus]